MTVLAKFVYEIKPGRFDDFMSILGQAAGPEFDSPVLPSSVRLFRCVVPGPDTHIIQLFIEYPDMTAYGQRTDFENNNFKWRALFAEQPDSPQRLVSVELLSEIVPSAPH
ncbi:hypothetical protein KVP09_00285 [Alcaligenaceae bacterium CGII-47]|nr:hypothetical protein [Alcaligenaceae bacterium CGII-47]